ncbi:MAG TPA: PEGA domain-containing protein [Kofleriaceae bacterium]|nr:PEGA domain-containing protein [Kofleriaceae bacterium]
MSRMFRVLSLVVFGLAALAAHASPAAAETVGVIVTGEATLQPPLVKHLEGWLRSHGHEVPPFSLDPSATSRLADCFTLDDTSCARKIVEAGSRTDSVVFARVTREGDTINLTVHWIFKGRPSVGGRRGCEPCSTDALRGAADELMASLAPAIATATGRLNLHSKPEGMIVMLDGVKIGVTPIDRDIAAGSHKIVLFSGATEVGQREIQVPAGSIVEVTIPVVYPPGDDRRPPPSSPSRVPPVLCWVGGGLALAASGYMFHLGQKGGADNPEDPYDYPHATKTGFALAGAGAAAIGVGVWLWVRGSRESAPVASIGPGGGYLAWQGRF